MSYFMACRLEISIKFANLTKRMWGLVASSRLRVSRLCDTTSLQSANWSNPKVDLQTR